MPRRNPASLPPTPLTAQSAAEAASQVQESAQQIWLAGLGAFADAQKEGGKAFQSLVQEGLNLQRQTQAVAEEKMAEAARQLSSLTAAATPEAAPPWAGLERLFEARVAKALTHLGTPSRAEFEALQAQVQALLAKKR